MTDMDMVRRGGFGLAFFALFCLLVVKAASEDPAPEDIQYAIVIDGGSTGCKVMAFTVGSQSCEEILNKRLVLPVGSVAKVTPGIATFASKMDELDQYIDRVIDVAKKLLPEEHHANTPIYLQCTAGMRLLSEEQQNGIMDKVRTAFRDGQRCPYVLEKDEHVAVIKGKYEGVYDWLSANYLRASLPNISKKSTSGIVDMGGASAEYTFLPPSLPKAHGVSVDLQAVGKFQLYSYSWLHYGQNEALKAVNGALGSDSVSSPCYPTGYSEQDGGRTISGQGNFETCRALVQKALIKPTEKCEQPPCGMNGIHIESNKGLDMKFILESSFGYTWEFFGLGEKATLAELDDKTQQHCSTSWDDIVKAHPAEKPEFLKIYCMTGVYFAEFLRSVGFTTDDRRLRQEAQIKHMDLDWPYGYLLVDKCGSIK